ncbi:YciI family protein [Sphingomonas sp. GB1N7]|uniref:YciI family protein n=1 Tax=Parasphingomonas caseinilytica TaxID=3096158 RepID=UPI002FC882DB
MPIYVITYEHPDEDGWKEYLMPHIDWLQAQLKTEALLASGPFSDRTVRPAMLIMNAADRPALDALIATDPFAEHGLIDNMTVNEWDPIFGAFNDRSSMPGQMQGR